MADAFDRAISAFKKLGGVLRTGQALESGVHPRTLYRLRDAGALEEVSRGVYRLASLPELSHPDLVTVALRVPRAIVCLISALAFHGLTSEIPHEVQVALPRGTRTPRLDHPPIRVFRYSDSALKEGVETIKVDGVEVRLFGPAKTIADCFRFRNKIGLDVAIEALRLGMKDGRLPPSEVLRYARVGRVENVILPYVEALS